MAIQNRRGQYADFDPSKAVAGELLTVLQGDPSAKDGKSVYMAFSSGSVKRLATYEDMADNIEEAMSDEKETIKQEITDEVEGNLQPLVTTAQTAAQTATTKANEASQSASSVSASAAQITTNKNDISDLKSALSETNDFLGYTNYLYVNKYNSYPDIGAVNSKTVYSANVDDTIEICISGEALVGSSVYLYFYYGDSTSGTGIGNIEVGKYKKYKLSQGISALSFYSATSGTTVGNYQIVVRTLVEGNIYERLDSVDEGLVEKELEIQKSYAMIEETNEFIGCSNYTYAVKLNTRSSIGSESYIPFSANVGDKISVKISGDAIATTNAAIYFRYGTSTSGTYIGGMNVGEYKEFVLTDSINGIQFYIAAATNGTYNVACRIIKNSVADIANEAYHDVLLQDWLLKGIHSNEALLSEYTSTASSISAGAIKPLYSARKGEKLRINISGTAIVSDTYNLYFYYGTSSSATSYGSIKKGEDVTIDLHDDINAITLYASNATSGNVIVKIETIKNKFPDYYCGYMYEKCARINELASACAAAGDAFIFITDQHWRMNQKHSVALISYINQKCRINRVFNGGDIDDAVSQTALDYMSGLQESYNHSIHTVLGNHELMGAYGNEWYYYADSYNNNQIGNAEKHYYYVDNPQVKTRYVILASYENTTGTIASGYTQEQINWMSTVAFDVPADWSIIIFAHDFYHTAIGINDVKTAIDTAKSNGKDIICVISGHTHYDAVWHTDGGVPIIVTTCDKNIPWIDQGADNEPWLTSYRITGQVSEQAFDVVIVDKKHKKITCVRIGGLAMNNIDKIKTDDEWTYEGTLEERVILYV